MANRYEQPMLRLEMQPSGYGRQEMRMKLSPAIANTLEDVAATAQAAENSIQAREEAAAQENKDYL